MFIRYIFLLSVFFATSFSTNLKAQGFWALAEELRLRDLQGDTSNLAQVIKNQQTRVVVVAWWASWCQACKREMKFLQQLSTKWAGDVVFIALSMDKQNLPWRKAVEKQAKVHRDLILHYRTSPEEALAMQGFLRMQSIPRYLIFDKQGKPLDLDAAFPSEKDFELKLREASQKK